MAEFTTKFFLFGALFYLLYKAVKNKNKNNEVLVAAAYVVGFEVFSRMTGGISFSYEFAKYMIISLLLVGAFYSNISKNSWPFVLFMLLLFPGILLAAINLNYGTQIFNAIGFNLSGPICLGIAAIYCNNRPVKYGAFQNILNFLLFPIISMTVYIYLYTPSVRDVLTGTASNFAASGGFGPNQVATVLGLGSFILFVRLIKIRDLTVNLVDLLLFALITYRGIVTFSRGGIITAAVCIILFCIVQFFYGSSRIKKSLTSKGIVLASVLIVVWLISSVSTDGLIINRYTGLDASGREKADVTSGRSDLLEKELEAFYQNPILGIGVGKVKEFIIEKTGKKVATHNEVSRMLSEHGLFGVLGLLILLITPLILRIKSKSNMLMYSFLAFWFLTINHSSMRIAAPAFVYGLCLISIIYAKPKKNTLRRKQIIQAR